MNRFKIIIPAYNVEKFCEKNLLSALDQDYSNYCITYINDHSDDNTMAKVRQVIKSHPKGKLVKVVDNQERKGALLNFFNEIHETPDEEIIVTLDGDDMLSTNQVLNILNRNYTKDIWLTWGSYEDVKSFNDLTHGTRGCSKPIPHNILESNVYRYHPWSTSHLRTFKAWLFKKIDKNDLVDKNGNFYNSAWDLSFMIPMIEMAGHRCKYIHDILYFYNHANPIQDYKVRLAEQQSFEREIRAKKRYTKI